MSYLLVYRIWILQITVYYKELLTINCQGTNHPRSILSFMDISILYRFGSHLTPFGGTEMKEEDKNRTGRSDKGMREARKAERLLGFKRKLVIDNKSHRTTESFMNNRSMA